LKTAQECGQRLQTGTSKRSHLEENTGKGEQRGGVPGDSCPAETGDKKDWGQLEFPGNKGGFPGPAKEKKRGEQYSAYLASRKLNDNRENDSTHIASEKTKEKVASDRLLGREKGKVRRLTTALIGAFKREGCGG